MHTSILHSPFTARIALLALALVAANAPLQSAKADDDSLKFDSQWDFNNHTEYAGADGKVEVSPDGKSLKLSFDFTKGGSFVSSGVTLSDPSNLSGIEVKAKGPGDFGISITDGTGQTFVYHLGTPGDTENTFQVDLAHPGLSYGGAGDKVIHYPLKNLNVTVSKNPDCLSGTDEVTEVLLKAAPSPTPSP